VLFPATLLYCVGLINAGKHFYEIFISSFPNSWGIHWMGIQQLEDGREIFPTAEGDAKEFTGLRRPQIIYYDSLMREKNN
jgi:hypothetical protein